MATITRPALLLLLALLGVANLATLVAARGGRHARNLVFTPTGGKIQVIMGFGLPVDLPHQAVTMGYVIKSNYLTPFNATQFTRPLEAFSQRSARDLVSRRSRRRSSSGSSSSSNSLTEHIASRWHLYNTLAEAVEQLGAGRGSGRQCMLKAVCEAAAFTMRHDGLLGELMHVLLTPSSTREPVLRHDDYEFHAAERAGRVARGSQDAVDACGSLFGGCSSGSLDLFTRMLPF